ncbi:MAG: hypothetical protein GY820_11425 [Gammaproteobacteria bacterium]|nr:hypothetical protein [Gammaproteobacteria bacterium]
MNNIDKLLELIQALRDPESGCPWDTRQTSASIARYTPGPFGTDSSRLSATHRAEHLQRQAAAQGFDWPDTEPVIDKLKEELLELEQAIASGDKDAIEDELGDLMFVCVNIARHTKINAEMALHRSNQKFIRRFKYVMAQMQASGQAMNQRQLDQMEEFWQASKAIVG